jgi:hypothetical protein
MLRELCLPYSTCELVHLESLRSTITNTHRFGIEFAPEVVQADGNVKNLSWRICNAKKVLVSLIFLNLSESSLPYSPNIIIQMLIHILIQQAPYSLSSPNGSSTPSEAKY